MEDIDKKRFCQLLIEKVEIRDEKNDSGRWVKSIIFKLPIIEKDLEISLDNNEHVEAVEVERILKSGFLKFLNYMIYYSN